MGIQEVQSQNGTPAYQKKKNAGRAEGFQESFLQNLKNRKQEKQANTAAETKQAVTDTQTEVKAKTEKVSMGRRIGTTPDIRMNAAATQEALQAVEVRHMSYEDSDYVRIAVTEGYTLKGKLLRNMDMAGKKNRNAVNGSGEEENGGAEALQVYVEAKYEDGRLEAYQVDTAKVSAGTEHMIERFALETLEEA